VLIRSNVVGALNVFEASRIAGVKRVVFASSGATVSGWEQEPPLSHLVAGRYAEAGKITPLTHESPLRPSGLYGATKVWGEALGRHYSDAHKMSVICLRIGRVKAEDRPTTTRDVAVWCSQRDIVRMIEACIEAPASLRFDVFYVVSNLRTATATWSTRAGCLAGNRWTAPTHPVDRRSHEMTYGYLPQNWPAFQRELDERGLSVSDIEKVEIRPSPAGSPTMVDVVVTARSGRIHTWSQDEGAPGR